MGDSVMDRVRVVTVFQHALLALLVIGIVGLLFSIGDYSVQGFAIKNIEETKDVQTYTKAFCAAQEGIRHCEDKLVIVVDGNEYITKKSEVSGAAQFLERNIEEYA